MQYKLTLLILFLFLELYTPQVQPQNLKGSPNMRLHATGLEIGSSLPDTLEVYSSNGIKMKVIDLFKNNPTVAEIMKNGIEIMDYAV